MCYIFYIFKARSERRDTEPRMYHYYYLRANIVSDARAAPCCRGKRQI